MAKSEFDFDILVIGAGPAGIAAACVAAESGGTVGIADDTPWLGGQIWRGEEQGGLNKEARAWRNRLKSSGAVLLSETSIIASPEPGCLLAEHRTGPRRIRWRKLILATGARELFLPFPGWTLPGVFGPGGLLALAKNGWPVQDRSVVVAGSGPLLLACAAGLKKLGARVISINEQAARKTVNRFAFSLWRQPGKLIQAARLRAALTTVPYRLGAWAVSAGGAQKLEHVSLSDGSRTWTERCDYFACAFGLVPNVELPLALGCSLKNGFVQVDESQQTTVASVYCAGEPVGIAGADCALVEGQIAGLSASGRANEAKQLFSRRNTWHRFRSWLARGFALRAEITQLASNNTLLCRCEDVALGEVRQYTSWREAKLHSRCGMGACQGRICGSATKVLLGWGMESVRPPVLPSRVESLVSDG